MANFIWKNRHGRYFRVRIPALYRSHFSNNSELRIPLHTSDRRPAKRLARAYMVTFDKDLAAGKKIVCPLNVLWGLNAPMGRQYDVLGIWQMEATRAEGKGIPGGHTFQVDSPQET